MSSITSSSAGSPPANANIAPAPPSISTTANMTSIAPSALVTMPNVSIGPTKNWVVPPRPRPGRKPATDTPPTKRKAQNRAAQRAFRERRAARVGELEEQLKETEDERLKRESEMHDQINDQRSKISRLLEDVQRMGRERESLQHSYLELEHKYEAERQEKEHVLVELSYLRNGARSTGTNAVPLPPRRRRTQPHAEVSRLPQYVVSGSALEQEALGCGSCTNASSCMCVEATMSIVTSGCGNCTNNSHCQCLEETLKDTSSDETSPPLLKRPSSVSPDEADLKRPRVSIEVPTPTEIDFTAKFLTKSIPSQERLFQDQNAVSRPAMESCGFCADGTYCVCAETAVSGSTAPESQENRLAPILSEVTPPPSENDVISSEISGHRLPLLHPNHRMHHALQSTGSLPVLPELVVSSTTGKSEILSADSCSNGPGSCKQCQDDPKSGLFCRSLAAMRASNSATDEVSTGCCGGVASEGGCCKSMVKSSLSLSCADTYKTLASHKNFDEASDELGTWLPKLAASAGRYPGRAPLDIEAASVMNVIKYFDVRFGRN